MLARPQSILKVPNSPRGALQPPKVSFQVPLDLVSVIKHYIDGSNKQDYSIVLRSLITGEVEDKCLSCWIEQLLGNITVLSPQCEGLLAELLKLNWASRSKEVVRLYKKFVPILTSAHTSNAKLVLTNLILHFTSCGMSSEADVVRALDSKAVRKKWGNIHSVLESLYGLVPTMPAVLLPLLINNFPYIGKDAVTQAAYVKNLLTITSYLPQLRKHILEIVVDRMIKIDVHCPRQDIEAAEESREDFEQDTLQMDGVEENGDPSKENGQAMAHTLANILDVLMEVVLDHLSKETSTEHGELDWEKTKTLFRDFLSLFEKIILPTYNCLHVQFLVFYMCSLKECLAEVFIDFLWKRFVLPSTPPILRHSCLAYISSLLSRGKFVSIRTVMACFDVIILWIHEYINSHSNREQSLADQAIHGPFYAACQLIFYVFAFRHKDFWELSSGPNYLQGLNFERIVTSQLNPLKFCLPVIVKNFAAVTRNYQLVYCNTVIERNNRTTLPSVQLGHEASAERCHRSIYTLFPFDPYLLIRSKKYIEPLYQEYSGDFGEDASQEEESEEFLEKVVDLSTSPMADFCDLFGYGTSPAGFKSAYTTKLK